MTRVEAGRRIIVCVVCVLLGGGAPIGQAPAQKSDAGVVATLSVTGCLERWSADPAAAATQPPAGVEYMLTNVEGQTVSATSTTSTPQRAVATERYLLLPAKGVDYASHLHHRVRIAGTIAPQPSTGASLAQQLADPGSRETNLPATPEAKSYGGNLVEVSALTMIARSCGN